MTEDLVKREDVISALASCGCTGAQMAAIRNVPAADTLNREPGKWIHDGSHWKYRFICERCGYKLFEEPTNYCPNCGAYMRKTEG